MTLADIIREVDKLDRKAWRALRQHLTTKLAGTVDDGSENSSLETQVLGAIVEAVRPHCYCSIDILRGNASYQVFKAKLLSVDEAALASADGVPLERWLEKSNLDRATRGRFLVYAYRLMLDEMRKRGITVDGVLLMNNTHRLPAYVDTAFPGYAANGMLSMLFRSKQGGGKARRMLTKEKK